MSIGILAGTITFAVLVAAFLGAFFADRQRLRHLHAAQAAHRQEQHPEPHRAKAA
jgi:hypothetical protein